eukprot:12414296-Karenia_brevis.AAC.1
MYAEQDMQGDKMLLVQAWVDLFHCYAWGGTEERLHELGKVLVEEEVLCCEHLASLDCPETLLTDKGFAAEELEVVSQVLTTGQKRP